MYVADRSRQPVGTRPAVRLLSARPMTPPTFAGLPRALRKLPGIGGYLPQPLMLFRHCVARMAECIVLFQYCSSGHHSPIFLTKDHIGCPPPSRFPPGCPVARRSPPRSFVVRATHDASADHGLVTGQFARLRRLHVVDAVACAVRWLRGVCQSR